MSGKAHGYCGKPFAVLILFETRLPQHDALRTYSIFKSLRSHYCFFMHGVGTAERAHAVTPPTATVRSAWARFALRQAQDMPCSPCFYP
jgi:hypothetical protein